MADGIPLPADFDPSGHEVGPSLGGRPSTRFRDTYPPPRPSLNPLKVRADNLTWRFAPQSSHIARWALDVDERQRRYDLIVTFKLNVGGETKFFIYHFPSKDQLDHIDSQLGKALHPFGTVLYPQVVKTGVPFSK